MAKNSDFSNFWPKLTKWRKKFKSVKKLKLQNFCFQTISVLDRTAVQDRAAVHDRAIVRYGAAVSYRAVM